MTPPFADRFWAKVNRREECECWEWTSVLNNAGYGTFTIQGKKLGAHRVAYELLVGEIPAGLEIDHLCRNRICVNPAHLEPVTHAENMRRSPLAVTAKNAVKTHCPQGHEYTLENTRHNLNRGKYPCRICRTCQRTYRARIAQERRAALSAA